MKLIYKDEEEVFEAFMSNEIDRKDAINILMFQFNMSSLDAASLVDAWEG